MNNDFLELLKREREQLEDKLKAIDFVLETYSYEKPIISKISLKSLAGHINNYFSVNISVKNRQRKTAWAKHIYFRTAKELGHGWSKMANEVNVTHATALTSFKTSSELLKNESKFASDYSAFKSYIIKYYP